MTATVSASEFTQATLHTTTNAETRALLADVRSKRDDAAGDVLAADYRAGLLNREEREIRSALAAAQTAWREAIANGAPEREQDKLNARADNERKRVNAWQEA